MRMRTLSSLLAAALLTLPSVAFAQAFEGIVKQRTISVERFALEDEGFNVSEALFDVPLERILALREDLETSGRMTVEETQTYIKGNVIRTDMETEEGPAYVTMDLEQGIIRMFQPEEKMYIEWTKADMERMKAMMPDMGGGTEEPEPRETGQSRTINGMRCVEYAVETDDATTRVWVSRDNAQLVTAFAALLEGIEAMGMGEDETDASALVAKYGFPVLVLQLGNDTYEIEETLSVDRQSVSDDLFTPPAGFTKMTMGDMMRGGYR
jgi:hypothetical protein